MKTIKLYVVLAIMVGYNQLYAQKTTYQARFPWTAGQISLTAQQKQTADSIYNALAPGESVKLNMLTTEEEKLTDLQRGLVSYRRAAAFIDYCVAAEFTTKEYYAEMVPFQMPHTLRSTDLSWDAYRSYMSKKSQSYFVYVRPKTMATAKAAAYFDASINNEKQEFTASWQNAIDLYPGNETHIHIPANSLQYTNGQNPSCENVTVRVAQYLDMDAMAMKAMTTSSAGKKLQTAGMWYIDVLCEGQKLVMKPGKKYTILVALKGDVKLMRVFTGQVKGTMLDWKEETDDKVILPAAASNEVNEGAQNEEETEYQSEDKYLYDRSYGERTISYEEEYDNYYNLQLNDFGWINCDAFDESNTLTDLMVGGDIGEGTNVMLVYAKRKSVLPGYLCEDGKTVKFSDIASEEAAMLVVFKPTDKKGNVVKYIKLIEPGKQKSINVHTTASTLTDLQTEIKNKLSDVY